MSSVAPKVAPRKATQLRMSEDELLTCVLDLAARYHWRRYHQRPNRLGQIVQGDKGFPDLVLTRPGPPVYYLTSGSANLTLGPSNRILFVELKSDRGRVSPEQQAWLDALSPYSAVWRPSMWHSGEIERALR